MLNKTSYPKWNTLPYYTETTLPKAVDKLAGEWPMNFFYRNSVGQFYDLDTKVVRWKLKNPNTINYTEELKEVVEMQNYLRDNTYSKYIDIAKFWGTGVPVNQWTPIALTLITSYKVTPPYSAKILDALQGVINDAFVICWYYKYFYNCPRPCQLDPTLKTLLNTPRFPSYPSGHSTVSGACEVLLSYFFPMEAEKLHSLANDASISRLYGGIHFRSDLEEGIQLGREIGKVAVNAIKKDSYSNGNPINFVYTNYANAPIMPYYYTL